jgi:hypothetical protein
MPTASAAGGYPNSQLPLQALSNVRVEIERRKRIAQRLPAQDSRVRLASHCAQSQRR